MEQTYDITDILELGLDPNGNIEEQLVRAIGRFQDPSREVPTAYCIARSLQTSRPLIALRNYLNGLPQEATHNDIYLQELCKHLNKEHPKQ